MNVTKYFLTVKKGAMGLSVKVIGTFTIYIYMTSQTSHFLVPLIPLSYNV